MDSFVMHSMCEGKEKERGGGTRSGRLPGGAPAWEGLTPKPPKSCPLNFHLHPQRKWVFQELGLDQQ